MVERRRPDRHPDFTGPGRRGVRDLRDGGVVQTAGGVEDERSYGRKTGATICSVGPAGIGVGVPPLAGNR
jgi:hypothetical protein